MKLLVETNEFHSKGIEEKADFRVANSAKMMKLLSDDLYSDKIMAVIRELSTNASDSHIDAGHNRPFDVYLPCKDNLEFKIRDYGTGLSKEDIFGLYRTYGESNKTGSNDYNGCLGLGSKAPFSYQDTFVCVSYFDGIKYVYVNTKDKNGIPSCNLLSQTDTEEPNGLEISIAVKDFDRITFHDKAVYLYRNFEVSPNIITDFVGFEGTIQERIEQKNKKTKILFSNGVVDLIKGYHNSSYVIMGQVQYPLSSIPSFSDEVKTLISHGVVIKAGIGDVEMAMSRESLQYNERTINYIQSELEKFGDHIRKEVQIKVNNYDFKWDSCAYLDHVLSERTIDKIVDTTLVKFKEEEKILDDGFIPKQDLKDRLFTKIYEQQEVFKTMENARISPDKNVTFVINDLNNKGYSASKRFISEGSTDICYIYNGKNPKEAIKLITDVYKYNPSEIKYTSSFPKAKPKERKKREKKDKNLFQCRVYNRSHSYFSSDSNQSKWSSIEVDINSKDYYYIGLNQRLEMRNEQGSSRFRYWSLKNIDDKLKLNGELFGLTEKRIEVIKDKKNWKHLSVFIKKYLDKWFKEKQNTRCFISKNFEENFNGHRLLRNFLKKETMLAKFLDKTPRETNNDLNLIEETLSCYTELTQKDYLKSSSVNINKIDKNFIKKRYPILDIVDSYGSLDNSQLKILANYANQIG